jgi:crotonobetainyl-CoA:carnitine CoA-transferase CaiB-like acyl-CoA transferase
MNTGLPLKGLRVIDVSRVYAMPYAAAHLADMGAEVIRVEACHLPDTRLQLFALPDNEPGELWWERSGTFHTLNRSKRSLTLDLTQDEALALLKRLIAKSDVVIENYTPRVSRRFGLDYPSLKKLKDDIILLSNTGYGHSGPWSEYGAVAATLESVHGTGAFMAYDGIPAKIGNSYTDFIAAWTALFALMAALIHRRRTGRGLWIDLAMYQVGAAFVGEGILDYAFNGRRQRPLGNKHLDWSPHGCYPCMGDNEWVTVAVRDDEEWCALCLAVGRLEASTDPKYANPASRYQRQDEVDEWITGWTRERDKYAVMEALQSAGVPCGAAMKARDLFKDRHYRHRGLLEPVRHSDESELGVRPYLGRGWRASGMEARIQGSGPMLGEANEYVLRDILGLSADEVARLEREGTIGRRPVGVSPPRPLSLEQQKALGWIQDYDSDYKDRLG